MAPLIVIPASAAVVSEGDATFAISMFLSSTSRVAVLIVVCVPLTVRFPVTVRFPPAVTLPVRVYVPVTPSVPPTVEFPVRVDGPDTVRFPAIVGLFSIFAPVTASFAIFPVVTLWSAT